MSRALAVLLLSFALAGVAPGADGVPAATVELREVELTYPAEGVVEAVRQATVAAQVSGRIVDMRVDAGDAVKAGQVLARIDEREATQAVAGSDAQVAQAQANLYNARAALERTRNLYAQKFVSQAALDSAEAQFRAADALLKAALAGRGQAGTAKTFTTITAPIAGRIAERHAELGEMAAPGRPLITVFDPAGLRVTASIPQFRLAQFTGTPRARVEFPESGRWVDAARVELLPTADARTHVVRARVELPEGTPGVRPGMYARVHFVIGTAKKLVVPAAAILRRGEVTGAYVIDAQGVPRLRQVRLGDAFAGGVVEVLAGLAAGEKVALDPVAAGIRLKQGRQDKQA